jgi:sirohydrochlorin cobaltochelatase
MPDGQPAGRGIVLFAHGSGDPHWRLPVERVARRIAALDPKVRVACAYLELMQPDLPGAVLELKSQGVRAIRVVPLFFGVGKHLRHDLPALAQRLRQMHPELELSVAPSLGEDDEVLELVARGALRARP